MKTHAIRVHVKASTSAALYYTLVPGLLATALLILNACGGGGGSQPGPPPTISNLTYSPSVVDYQSGNGTATITGTLSFSDPAGDLASIRITSSTGLNATIPVTGARGETSGSVTGTITVSTSTQGHFPFELWVVDANGSASNHLSGSFDVVPVLGTTWTRQASATTADLHRVAWSGSDYVAVGTGGAIVRSPDGISWTQQISGTTESLYGVTWTGTRFVAVGDHGTALASPDGVTWVPLITGRTDATLLAVSQGADELVVVGGQGAGNGGNPGNLSSLILSTADDVVWTERGTSVNNWWFDGLAWSGKTFVAVGGSSMDRSVVIWTSADGISWSSQDLNIAEYGLYLHDLIWSGSQFVAIGQGFGVLSSDAVRWQPFGQQISQISGTNTSFGLFASGVASSDQNYLAVGDSFGQIERSVDALNWTETIPAAGLGTLYGVVGGRSGFVAVGQAGAIFTSP